MSVVDVIPLIRKYEMGEPMTHDEKEILTAGLYFLYRKYEQRAIAADEQSKEGARS